MMKKPFILALLLLSFSCKSGKLYVKDSLELIGDDWQLSMNDSPDYSSADYDSSSWKNIYIPQNIFKVEKGFQGTFWIRKSFDFSMDSSGRSFALRMGRVVDRDEVYLNGQLIGLNGDSPDSRTITEYSYGRNRVYPIPAQILKNGENILAIRITSEFSGMGGILKPPMDITLYSDAIQAENYSQTLDLVYISFYIFVGIFFFLNHIKMTDKDAYLNFALFTFGFSLFEFSRNDFRLIIWNNFLGFKFLEYSSLFLLPPLYLNFLHSFFQKPKWRYINHYFLLNVSFILLFALYRKPTFWHIFAGFWDAHVLGIIGYSFYFTYLRFKEGSRGSVAHTLALLFFGYAFIREVLIVRGFLYAPSILEESFLIYILLMTLALRIQFILEKLKIQRRLDQLEEADQLREKIFQQMEKVLSEPIKHLKELFLSWQGGKGKEADFDKADVLQNKLTHLLEDTIELSRLEVLGEVPYRERVEFVDYIKNVLPDKKLTYTILVDPKTSIRTSLELLNSIVNRIVDFTPFREFSHNDLIVTQDLKGNIHFRFLLYNPESRKTISLYNQLNKSEEMESNIRIQWKIIMETLRLLDGKMEMKIIKKKYLRIDFGIAAEVPDPLVPVKQRS
jgi:hypothetical protein